MPGAGAVWAVAGQVLAAFVFTIEDDRIAAIDPVMDCAELAGLDVTIESPALPSGCAGGLPLTSEQALAGCGC